MPREDISMTGQEVRDFLDDVRTAVLSTIGPDGMPHSVGMWYVRTDDELLMWAYAKSQKVRNLERDPRCAFLVETGMTYSELRGVLVRGSARIVRDYDQVERIGVGLFERYTLPRLGIPLDAGPIVELRRQARKRVGLVLGLDMVASWDHDKLGRHREQPTGGDL